MKTSSFVSIVIPVYNRLDQLEITLKSVKNQTYEHYEVILIDDASEVDINYEGIREKFNFSAFKYEKLSVNKGPGGARRRGRELAEDEYIAYLDSDDEWTEEFLERTIDILEKHSHISMVFTACVTKNRGELFKKTNIKSGTHDYHNLVFNQGKTWATGAGVWRDRISKPENWKDFRDHEDFVHDILSTSFFSEIYHIPEYLCVVNKNETLGVKRSNKEMLKALQCLAKDVELKKNLKVKKKNTYFSSFVLFRMKRRKYKFSDLPKLLAVFFALMKFGNHKQLRNSFFKIILKITP